MNATLGSPRRRALALAAIAIGTAARQGPNGCGRPAQAEARLLVVDKAQDALVLVDVERMAVAGRVPTGRGPHEVAAEGTLAFVTNYGTGDEPGHSLSIIDLPALREQKRLDLAPHQRPHGIVCRDGGVWFTTEGTRTVHRYDIATETFDWVNGTGQELTHMIAVAPGATKVWTTNIASRSVSVFERPRHPAAPWKLTRIEVGEGPEGIDVSPDGREVWVARRADGGVSILDAIADSVAQILPTVAELPLRVKFTPDGRRVLLTDIADLRGVRPGSLVVLDAAERRVVGRVPLGLGPLGIVAAPDNQRAFIALTMEGRVVAVDLARMAVAGSVTTGGEPDGLWWVE